MTLKNLSENQKKAFLELAKKLILCDSKLYKQEVELLENMNKEMGIDLSTTVKYNDIKELYGKFTTDEEKELVLEELTRLSFADGFYSKEEKDFVKETADFFEVSGEVLDKLEQKVK